MAARLHRYLATTALCTLPLLATLLVQAPPSQASPPETSRAAPSCQLNLRDFSRNWPTSVSWRAKVRCSRVISSADFTFRVVRKIYPSHPIAIESHRATWHCSAFQERHCWGRGSWLRNNDNIDGWFCIRARVRTTSNVGGGFLHIRAYDRDCFLSDG